MAVIGSGDPGAIVVFSFFYANEELKWEEILLKQLKRRLLLLRSRMTPDWKFCTIADIVAKVKEAGKTAMVHMDLITGLSPKDISTDFIRKYTLADGIITTKGNLISHAKEIGLATVLRYFVLDSMALINIERQSHQNRETQPDMIEILPGIIVPKMIRKICAMSRVPVICGGLIQEKEDVMHALASGAAAISTTCPDVWFM